MHAVPGRVVREFVIPAREYVGLTMKQGQARFLDIEDRQVPDLVCFNERDLSEDLNLGNSLLINKRREFIKGNVLYSVICNPLMTITGYSTRSASCSEEVNRIRYGVAGTRNCRDNFAMALSGWGFTARRIPDVRARGGGGRRHHGNQEPTSKPGDYYDLRAEMDLVIGISNCPQERNPCNGFNPTATGVIVYES